MIGRFSGSWSTSSISSDLNMPSSSRRFPDDTKTSLTRVNASLMAGGSLVCSFCNGSVPGALPCLPCETGVRGPASGDIFEYRTRFAEFEGLGYVVYGCMSSKSIKSAIAAILVCLATLGKLHSYIHLSAVQLYPSEIRPFLLCRVLCFALLMSRFRYPHSLAMLDLLVNNPAFRKV